MPQTVGPTFPVIVTSYEVVMNDSKALARYDWKYLVVDEVCLIQINFTFVYSILNKAIFG
jgi:hypothetical protein